MNWKEDVRAALALAQGHLSAPNAPTSVIIIFKGKGTFRVQLAGKPFLKPKKGKALTGLAEALAAAVAQGQGDQFSVPPYFGTALSSRFAQLVPVMLAIVGPLAAVAPPPAPPPAGALLPPLLPHPMSAAPATPAPTAIEPPRNRRRDTEDVFVQYR